MRTKSLALLALALGCGLVASIGITQVLAKRGADPAGVTGETETIFVALKEVPMGDVLNAQLVRLEPWPKEKVPPGALTKLEDVEGRRVRTSILAGDPIREDRLFRKGENDNINQMIPPGYRTVGVKVDNVSTGGNLIKPGDRVDVLVYLTKNPQHDIPETQTRPVLEDIKVFAVNDVVGMGSEKEKGSIKAMTVTLLVKPDQAPKLTLASELGSIRLVMRSLDDAQNSGFAVATPADLLGTKKSDTGNADKEQQAMSGDDPGKPALSLTDILKSMRQKAATQPGAGPPQEVAVAPATPSQLWTMRIIRGNAIDDVTLQSAGATIGGGTPGLDRWYSAGTTSGAAPGSGATAAPAGPAANNGGQQPQTPPATDQP
jgi:pilus assembly protein CpaB